MQSLATILLQLEEIHVGRHLMDERLERAHVADVPAEFSRDSASCALNQNPSSAVCSILIARNLHVDSMYSDLDADSESEVAFANFESGNGSDDCCKDDIRKKFNCLCPLSAKASCAYAE